MAAVTAARLPSTADGGHSVERGFKTRTVCSSSLGGCPRSRGSGGDSSWYTASNKTTSCSASQCSALRLMVCSLQPTSIWRWQGRCPRAIGGDRPECTFFFAVAAQTTVRFRAVRALTRGGWQRSEWRVPRRLPRAWGTGPNQSPWRGRLPPLVCAGTPFTITANGADLNMPGNMQTANLNGSYKVIGDKGNAGFYFDPTPFSQPTGTSLGNAGRNQFRRPVYRNVDFSIFRGFPIRSGARRPSSAWSSSTFSIAPGGAIPTVT
jgi:hypothetical protein